MARLLLCSDSVQLGTSIDESSATTVRSLDGVQHLPEGEVLGGCYRICGLLGTGGMGEVYAAHDQWLGREVAIKVSLPSIEPTSLLREARILANFRHPGLPLVHAMGKHRERHYVVMEQLSGPSLADRLLARWAERHAMKLAGVPCDDPSFLPVEDARDVLAGIARSVAIIHRADLVHRDLKPANIILAKPDRIVLVDFGIAAAAEQLRGDVGDDIVGSSHYMAPEVVTGAIRAEQAHLVDIYALGVIGFQLLTGRTPFTGKSATEVISKQVFEAVPALDEIRPRVPRSLTRLVMDMLQKHPDDRPPSIDIVRDRLSCVDPAG